jgi:SAM-dependent methyltransferase
MGRIGHRRTMERVQTIVNTDQAAAWNGPEGASWAERPVAPLDGDLAGDVLAAAALSPADVVIDVGCGTGDLTRRVALEVPDGHVTGIDLSDRMIEEARRAARWDRIVNATFLGADAQVHRFPPAAADVALSHFGIMFFSDPVAAFANVGRALRPGGRLAFACPGPLDACLWYTVPLAALVDERPTERSTPSAMFSLADRARLTTILGEAGFVDVEVVPRERALWFGADVEEAVQGYLGSGPVRAVLERRPDLSLDGARRRLEGALADHTGPDGVRLGGLHWLVTARRP